VVGTVLWWLGNLVLLLAVIPVVVFLATKIISRTLEIRRYAADIREHGTGIATNLEATEALEDTHRNTQRVREAAGRYLAALEQS
jgi:hypothetical protein